MKTLDELKEMTREELIVCLWDLQQEKNLIQELKLLRMKSEAFTICLFEEREDSFFFGRLDLVLQGLVGCVDIVSKKSGILLEDVMNEIINKIKVKR